MSALHSYSLLSRAQGRGHHRHCPRTASAGLQLQLVSEIAAFDCMIMIRYFVRIGIESYLHRPLTQLHYPCVGVKSASVLIVSPGPEGILRGCCNMNMSGHESEVTGGGNKREDKFVTEYFW